eukprot:1176218-Prorocentrum_minimum.AAC.2
MRYDSDEQFWRSPNEYDEYEDAVEACSRPSSFETNNEGEDCTSGSEHTEACPYSERIRALLQNSRRGAAPHDALKLRHALARQKAGFRKLIMLKQRYGLAKSCKYEGLRTELRETRGAEMSGRRA